MAWPDLDQIWPGLESFFQHLFDLEVTLNDLK